MIVSFKHKYIYIKNKKVGGSSLEKYLIDKLVDKKIDIHTGTGAGIYRENNIKSKSGKKVPSHMSILMISKLLKTNIEYLVKKFFIFSIERNPYNKCVSMFSSYNNNNFTDFMMKRENLPVDWPRYTFNNNIIGKVFLYENYHDTFYQLNHFLKLNSKNSLSKKEFDNYDLKSFYREKNDDYRKYYNAFTKKIVESNFKREINTFGYKF